jgi:hypothetical protein
MGGTQSNLKKNVQKNLDSSQSVNKMISNLNEIKKDIKNTKTALKNIQEKDNQLAIAIQNEETAKKLAAQLKQQAEEARIVATQVINKPEASVEVKKQLNEIATTLEIKAEEAKKELDKAILITQASQVPQTLQNTIISQDIPVTQYIPVTKDIQDIPIITPIIQASQEIYQASHDIINASQDIINAVHSTEVDDDTDVEASGEVDGIDEINNSTIPKSGLDISKMKPKIKISNKKTKNKFRILDGFQMKCPDGFIQQGTHCGRLIEISNSSFGKKDIETFNNSSNKQDNTMIMLIILGLILMLAYRNQDLVRRYIKF